MDIIEDTYFPSIGEVIVRNASINDIWAWPAASLCILNLLCSGGSWRDLSSRHFDAWFSYCGVCIPTVDFQKEK
jgi:hypothetical protein